MSARLILLLLLCWPTLALADYKSAFDAGRVAAERQEWARVQSKMREALADRADPSASIKIEGFAYLPKFYLGLAAFSLNDCPGAMGFLEDPATLAAMSGLREANRQQLMVRICKNRIAAAGRTAPATTATTAATPPVATPPAAGPAVRPPPPVRPPVTPARPADPPPAATAGADPGRLRALRDQLVVIDSNLQTSDRALADAALGPEAVPLRERFVGLAGELKRLRPRVSAADGKRDLAQIPQLERDLAALSKNTAALSRELVLAQNQGRERARAASAADAQRLRALRADMAVALEPLLQLYLAGDYTKLAAARTDPRLDQLPAAKAQALLLRAAGRHAQFVLTGEHDAAMADQARADILEARRLAADLNPSARAFSPRFRSFFASAR